MFDSAKIARLAQESLSLFQRLSLIEDELRTRYFEMDQAIRALVLAAATGEPLLLIGPPGTGKSHLVRAFSRLIGAAPLNEIGAGALPRKAYAFEYLLTPFTEPAELFGYYDIQALLDRERAPAHTSPLRRLDQGMMQHASVVYLDEVFNGSSAILNSLLAFLNERKLHDRGQLLDVDWKCLFAATNLAPEAPELRAVFDRFVLRCWVDNVQDMPDKIRDFLAKGWLETYGQGKPANGQGKPAASPPPVLNALDDFRLRLNNYVAAGLRPEPGSALHNQLAFQVANMRQLGLSDMSNRRLVRYVRLMLVHRAYRAVRDAEVTINRRPGLELAAEELCLLPAYAPDRRDETAIQKLIEAAKRYTPA